MKVNLYIKHHPKYKAIVVRFPDKENLIETISREYKVFGNTTNEKIKFIKNNYKNLNITVLNFEYANASFIRTIESLKDNIKYLNLVTNDKIDKKSILHFLRRYNARIRYKNKIFKITEIVYLEPLFLSIALLILLYLYWYMFAMAMVILLFYVITKNVIKNN